MNGERKVIGGLTVADIAEALTAVFALTITLLILCKWG